MDEHLLRFDKDKLFVFLDFETENLCLNFVHNMPWQLAMIKSKGGKKIDEKNYHIKFKRLHKIITIINETKSNVSCNIYMRSWTINF